MGDVIDLRARLEDRLRTRELLADQQNPLLDPMHSRALYSVLLALAKYAELSAAELLILVETARAAPDVDQGTLDVLAELEYEW